MTDADGDNEMQSGCGAIAPDDRCGECQDCLDEDDDWRQLHDGTY